jgi:hypothetical protein
MSFRVHITLKTLDVQRSIYQFGAIQTCAARMAR